MMKLAKTFTEWAGLALAGSFMLWPPEWQLAAFAGGMVLALCLHPIAHLAAFIGYVGAVLTGRGLAHAAQGMKKMALAIILIPPALLFVLLVGLFGRRQHHS